MQVEYDELTKISVSHPKNIYYLKDLPPYKNPLYLRISVTAIIRFSAKKSIVSKHRMIAENAIKSFEVALWMICKHFKTLEACYTEAYRVAYSR